MILFLILFSVCILFLIALYLIYHLFFLHPMKKRPDPHNIPAGPLYDDYRESMLQVVKDMETSPHMWLQVTSHDGLRLYARLYGDFSSEKPVVLFFHGYRGRAEWDGYGMYRICKKLGYPILMPDMRAHGKSEGTISFGIREYRDVQLWIDEALRRFGHSSRFILAGVSMGATSVLLAAGNSSLPDNVIGIVSDCAFSHPSGLLRPIYEEKKLPAKLLFRVMRLSARLFGGFRLDETVAIEAVTKLSVPVLFLHGTKDKIVPVSMCDELYEACSGPKRKLILTGADHANSAMAFPEAYEAAVLGFLEDMLTEKQG